MRADQPRWSTPVTVTPNGGAPSDGGAVADVGREIASSKKCIHETRRAAEHSDRKSEFVSQLELRCRLRGLYFADPRNRGCGQWLCVVLSSLAIA